MYIYVPCSVEASPLHLGSRWLTLFLHWWMHGRWLMVMAHSLVIDMLLCLIDNIVVLLARGKARDKFVLREIAPFSFYLFFPANDGFWINLHVFIPYIFLSFSLSDFRGFQQPITTTPYPALPYHAPAGKQVKAADQAGSASVKLEPMSTNQTVAYSSQSQPCVFDSCLVSDAYVVCVFDFMFLFGCAWCVCAWVLVWGSLSFSLTTFFCLLVFFLCLCSSSFSFGCPKNSSRDCSFTITHTSERRLCSTPHERKKKKVHKQSSRLPALWLVFISCSSFPSLHLVSYHHFCLEGWA